MDESHVIKRDVNGIYYMETVSDIPEVEVKEVPAEPIPIKEPEDMTNAFGMDSKITKTKKTRKPRTKKLLAAGPKIPSGVGRKRKG